MKTKNGKPVHGKLIWLNSRTSEVIIIKTGPFALLQHKRKEIEDNPQFSKGIFKITY